MAEHDGQPALSGTLHGGHFFTLGRPGWDAPGNHGAAMATHPLQSLTRAPVDIVAELSLSSGDTLSVQVRGPADAHYLEGGAAPVDPDTGHVQRSGGWAYFTVSSPSAPIWYWTTGGATRIVVSSS